MDCLYQKRKHGCRWWKFCRNCLPTGGRWLKYALLSTGYLQTKEWKSRGEGRRANKGWSASWLDAAMDNIQSTCFFVHGSAFHPLFCQRRRRIKDSRSLGTVGANTNKESYRSALMTEYDNSLVDRDMNQGSCLFASFVVGMLTSGLLCIWRTYLALIAAHPVRCGPLSSVCLVHCCLCLIFVPAAYFSSLTFACCPRHETRGQIVFQRAKHTSNVTNYTLTHERNWKKTVIFFLRKIWINI